MNILEKILTAKKKSLEEQKNKLSVEQLKKRLGNLPPTRNFLQAISLPEKKLHLIAEIKKASPSAGKLVTNFALERIARDYQDAGAVAISVLTEEKCFLGEVTYLEEVRKIVNLPVLRKDFIFDSYQVYESRYFGADAFLLIASILTEREIEEFICLGHSLGMDVLVEVHNEEELNRVLNTSAKIIGINNRNLRDLNVDLNITLQLRKKISKDKIVVSESGIKTKEDVELLKNAGVNAVLIGETLIRSKNIKETVKKLGL